MNGRLGLVGAFVAAVAISLSVGAPALGANGNDEAAEIGTRLADMLRAGRSVVSANQDLINDPSIGDKNFTGDFLVAQAQNLYAERTGQPALDPSLPDDQKRLVEAQIQAMRIVVDGHQNDINKEGIGFKGFIPAVFARLVNEEFAALAGEQALVRVTAPIGLVRNRKARPDDWEKDVLESRLLDPDWETGAAYTEVLEFEGRPAFRMLLPEYYRESCLSCHGGPVGETDITGYPKEGGKVGDLGGAISIIIFQ